MLGRVCGHAAKVHANHLVVTKLMQPIDHPGPQPAHVHKHGVRLVLVDMLGHNARQGHQVQAAPLALFLGIKPLPLGQNALVVAKPGHVQAEHQRRAAIYFLA